MNNKILRDYYVAELKYFNTDTSGDKKIGVEKINPLDYESTDPLSYVLLITDDGVNFRNALNESEEYPTYYHSNIPQYHRFPNGEEEMIGLKVKPINKEQDVIAGPCWVLNGTVYNNKTLDEMETFVVNSNDYYKDRFKILSKNQLNLLTNIKKVRDDFKKEKRMINYFNDHGVDDFNIVKGKTFSKKR